MVLSSIRLENFCCYQDFVLNDLQSLVVVIGENDVGKTVLLDAIHVLCEPTDYNQALHACKIDEESYADEVVVEGTFELEGGDGINSDYILNNRVRVKHTFDLDGTTTEVYCEAFADEEAKNWNDLLAKQQKDYLKRFGLESDESVGNKTKRQDSFDQLDENGDLPMEECWIEVGKRDRKEMLPAVQRISAEDFKDPDRLIKSALQRAVRAAIHEENPETGERWEIDELDPVRHKIEEAVRQEVKKAEDILKAHHNDLVEIDIDPHLDFSSALDTSFLTVDMGHGKKRVRSFGRGTKRRLWMGLLEWDGDVAIEEETPTLRLYDEPDVNLHYNAQRKLLQNISRLSQQDEANVQCFACTHSVTFINRVPPKNLVLLDTEGRERVADQVRGPDADDFSAFYDSIGMSVGLTNVSLLFEHAFLLVEGPSEFRAIPILYKKLFGTSLHTDRIKPINLEGCGSWRSVLKVLLSHREDFVHLLLDEDCKQDDSPAKINGSNFEDLGIDPSFLETNVSFVGDKEYEDAFSDEVIVRTLNEKYEREDGRDWKIEDVASLREADKFSDRLKGEVRRCAVPRIRSRTSKPDLAEATATSCSADDIPEDIEQALIRLREQAGIAY